MLRAHDRGGEVLGFGRGSGTVRPLEPVIGPGPECFARRLVEAGCQWWDCLAGGFERRGDPRDQQPRQRPAQKGREQRVQEGDDRVQAG